MRQKLLLACALLAVPAVLPAALYDEFRNPPASYSLMPYWYWNGHITPAETRREIQEMIRQGVHQAILFPWDGMEVRYLSEDYWREIAAALDIARELKFTLNLADEYDWPSAHAWDFGSRQPELSRVLQRHPEYRMQRLDAAEQALDGPAVWRLPAGATPEVVVAARQDLAGNLEADSLAVISGGEWNAPAGRWLITVFTRLPAVGAHNTRVNLLNPDAVKTYLDLVYEEYARRFPQHLGTTLKLTVADHEGAYGAPIAWTPRLWEEFRKRKGRDLRRELPLLAHRTTDPRRGRATRSDYLDVISDLYADAFTRQVAEWCRRHGLLHATSAYEEQLYIQVGLAGDMFRHWRAGSLVEIDALLERARMPIDFKEAVSVAHFDGKPLVVENQGLQGHESFFSLEKARLGTNMCLLWGANFLVPYFDYEQRKIAWPPQWFLSQPFWRYFHHYADYVRRAQFLNAQGTHVAPVAIYYPLEAAFANSETLLSTRPHRDLLWNNSMDQTQNFYTALQLELARAGWDYHILDAEYLRRAELRGAALRLGGEEIRAVIVPPMTDMAASSAEKLRLFAAAGGTVLTLGSARFPVREHPPFMDRLDYMRQIEVPAGIQDDLRPMLAALRAAVPPEVEAPGEHWFASHRRSAEADWFWVVNDTDRERAASWRFPGKGRLEKWDAETAERTPLCEENGRVRLRFGPWDAYFVVRTPGPPAPCVAGSSEQVLVELPRAGWRFTPETKELYVPYASVNGGEPVWLQPERRSNPSWWLTGPFPYDDHRGFFAEWPPERGFDPAGWTWYESPTYTVTLRDALPKGRAPGVYYAFVYVYSPRQRPSQMVAAVADSMQAWINGERVLFEHRHPKWNLLRDAWAEKRDVKLRRGWNTVLLKIESSLSVPTAFLFRLTGDGLVYARERKLPERRSQSVRLTVEVPPGAVGHASRAWTFDAPEIPDHPVAFRTGTVPFTLESWTDSALRHYSGTARYETEFELPALPRGKRIELDLGEVGVAAEVWVNGKSAGERVWRPFRFDITDSARAGVNRLVVRVANSAAGWQAQGGTIYPKGSWGLQYRTERDRLPKIRPNGLEGPVRVLAR